MNQEEKYSETDANQKLITQKEARHLSTVSHTQPKADKDIQHDAEKIELLPKEEANNSVVIVKSDPDEDAA